MCESTFFFSFCARRSLPSFSPLFSGSSDGDFCFPPFFFQILSDEVDTSFFLFPSRDRSRAPPSSFFRTFGISFVYSELPLSSPMRMLEEQSEIPSLYSSPSSFFLFPFPRALFLNAPYVRFSPPWRRRDGSSVPSGRSEAGPSLFFPSSKPLDTRGFSFCAEKDTVVLFPLCRSWCVSRGSVGLFFLLSYFSFCWRRRALSFLREEV